ncbi:hypothetical protein M5689_008500 [Euphorbia peplus]|nr:hypothetical protein M5689_008500 [Euphorbia peplus]
MNAAVRQWRGMVMRMRMEQKRGMAARSEAAEGIQKYNKYAITGEYAPIYMIGGFVTLALCIGIHTAKQQLLHAPGNYFSKKKRESFPEIDTPDSLVKGSHNFIKKSFLRKVAHIQQDSPTPLASSRNTPETLKSVGVKPRSH